jgi:exodeoxyribonuclease-3
MLILSWNVNGIRAVGKKGFVDFLNKKKPDILGIQEVKIGDTLREKAEFNFGAYTEYWNSAKRPGYAGTMTLIKDNPTIGKRFMKHTTGIGNEEFDSEGRTQVLEFDTFYLMNAYFPNSRDDLSRIPFKQKFNKLIIETAKKMEKKKPVIIMGDFNVAHEEIDIARPKQNEGNKGFTKEERDDFTWMLKKGFVDTFRTFYPDKIQYSWWTPWADARARNVGWRIDYILASKILLPHIKKAYILDDVFGSDHCPIGIEIDI